MTDKWKYKSVSLKTSTYSMLNDLTKTLIPGVEISNAKVVDTLIRRAAQCNSSRDTKENYNGKEKLLKI